MVQEPNGTNATSDTSIRSALFNQLSAGPTYPEVAAVLLRDALKELYPSLDIDPFTTIIGESAWDIVEGDIVERPTLYVSLSDLLAAKVDDNQPVLLIEGQHFLTQLPLTLPQVHLPVRIDQIGRLINVLVPAMLPASQEQQLAYWNIPFGNDSARWHELSNTLRKMWDIKQVKGWTATECDMARQLFLYPDPKDRKDSYQSHAYLIDIKATEDDRKSLVTENTLMVLIGQIDKKEVILAHSLLNGYQKFDSRDALGQSLSSYFVGMTRPTHIEWRLYEPSGNIFDSKACGIIAQQVKILGLPSTKLNAAFAEAQSPSVIGRERGPGEAWYQQQIPEWLKRAPVPDQVLYAQYMKNLSALSSSQAGKTYLDEILPIKAFASQALKTQMQSDHDDASKLDPEKIEIEVKSPVVWGSFVNPFQLDTTRFTLVELALQNLIAVPSGNKTVKSLDETELPEWMTVDYIEDLIKKVDIGRVYPELIQRKLLDDPEESARREQLYISQLRIQLPMLALEQKIRGQGDIDDLGCRYVSALMQPREADRKVDGEDIVLRKLAFVSDRQIGVSEDIVANMFVIGPKTASAGPCLLYRPLLEPQLYQFPSFSNLLYGIRQTDSLRRSVLAWLPDNVREDYSRFIFPGALPSPWAVVEFATNPVESWADSGPLSLSDETLGNDFMPLLFKANANALVTLADHQSVSERENRWESLRQTDWIILSLALPYLGTTVNDGLWLWQILDDTEQLTQQAEELKGAARWERIVDLLLNVALGLINIAIEKAGNRKRPTEAPEIVPAPGLPKPKSELKIEERTPLAQTELPQEHFDVIHTSGALMGKSKTDISFLDSFSIEAPDNPGEPESEGALKGLYQKNGDRYVKLQDKWFQVAVVGEQVSIIDGSRNGPPLVQNKQGLWQVDNRLRLSGGGSKGARQKTIVEAQRRSLQLLDTLKKFEEQKKQDQKLLTMEAQAMNQASGAAKETQRQKYITTLKTQRDNYEAALNTLIEWPVFQSRRDAPRIGLGYLNAQINFTFAEIDALNARFDPAMTRAQDMITSPVTALEQQHIDAAENIVSVSDDMIERLDYMETRFDRLKALGRSGYGFVREHREKMPLRDSDSLRLLQLDMYRHLCLTLESVETMPEGWVELNRVVDNATVAFQSLRDAIGEREVIRQDEQIDALGSLTEQFAAIEEHLDYLESEYPGSAIPSQFSRLRRRIRDAKKRALRHLAQALDERSNQRHSPRPEQRRPRPRKKFIRTRYWGLVSGEPRLSKSYEETDWVDVRNPFTNNIIATFHRKETGDWALHMTATAPQVIPPLDTSVSKGQALLDGLPAFKTTIEKAQQQPDRTPAGIAMRMNGHAHRMETIATAIEKALDQAANQTVELPQAKRKLAETMKLDLRRHSRALNAQQLETVESIIKQSPPTMSNVIWLQDRNQIRITRTKKRQRVKLPLKGYVDRYEISDKKTGKTLWFADFYYSAYWGAERRYLLARLKSSDQVNPEASEVATKRLSQRQLIDHYRSEIAVDQAEQVFFTKRKP